MRTIDWRDLYASNQAVINGSLPATTGGGVGAPVRDAGEGLERFAHHDGRRERPCFVHVPPSLSTGTPAPLVVMLHGCSQTAADLAAGTLMNEAADRHGFVVLYPQQTTDDNQQACWNWFAPTHQQRDGGDPGFIAGATRRLLSGERPDLELDPRRVFVAGLSAGGAMAAILAATHPDLFDAVAIHSGLPYRSATDLPGAFQAMAGRGAQPGDLGPGAAVRCIVVHGTADRTVVPANGELLVEQWLAANHRPRHPAEVQLGRVPGGLSYEHVRWRDRTGRPVQEHLRVEGLGHAWSGGSPDGSYTDARGPSATEAIWRFFAAGGGDDQLALPRG
jgi:poly(hydroxyalkanoate) depolymerase family esterase